MPYGVLYLTKKMTSLRQRQIVLLSLTMTFLICLVYLVACSRDYAASPTTVADISEVLDGVSPALLVMNQVFAFISRSSYTERRLELFLKRTPIFSVSSEFPEFHNRVTIVESNQVNYLWPLYDLIQTVHVYRNLLSLSISSYINSDLLFDWLESISTDLVDLVANIQLISDESGDIVPSPSYDHFSSIDDLQSRLDESLDILDVASTNRMNDDNIENRILYLKAAVHRGHLKYTKNKEF
jgi:hypothetical protein